MRFLATPTPTNCNSNYHGEDISLKHIHNYTSSIMTPVSKSFHHLLSSSLPVVLVDLLLGLASSHGYLRRDQLPTSFGDNSYFDNLSNLVGNALDKTEQYDDNQYYPSLDEHSQYYQ